MYFLQLKNYGETIYFERRVQTQLLTLNVKLLYKYPKGKIIKFAMSMSVMTNFIAPPCLSGLS